MKRVLVFDGSKQLVAPSLVTVARYYGVSYKAVCKALKLGDELVLGVTLDETDESLKPSPCFADMNAYRSRHRDRETKQMPQKADCHICENCAKYSTLLLPDGSSVGICRVRSQAEEPVAGRWDKVGKFWHEEVERWHTCPFFVAFTTKEIWKDEA